MLPGSMWRAIGLGLGGNLGDAPAAIMEALRCLEARGHVRLGRVSSIYRTPPWGPVAQADFANACALAQTDLAPRALLAEVKAVETLLGREPGLRWGPRRIDVDILFYEGATLDTPDLVIPHQSLFERAFVLVPLAEIAPDLRLAGRSVAAAAAAMSDAGIEHWFTPRGATIAERDTTRQERTMGEMLDLTTEDGATISAYRAAPAGTPKGGLVVLQEVFGVNPHIRSVADRFAAAGYLAVAPALFDRVEKGVELAYDEGGMGRGLDLMKKVDQGAAMHDVAAAMKAASDAGSVGVVGFCWGGTLAYAAATSLDGFSAAVGYYGGGIASIVANRLHCPVELHFGEQDSHIPMSDVDKIRHAHPGMAVYTYPAGHGFNCDVRGSYDKPSADLAWSRTIEFLGRHIKKERHS